MARGNYMYIHVYNVLVVLILIQITFQIFRYASLITGVKKYHIHLRVVCIIDVSNTEIVDLKYKI